MAKRGRKRRSEVDNTPSNTKIVLNSRQIAKASNKRLPRRKKDDEDSIEVSEEEVLDEVLEESSGKEDDVDSQVSYESEDIEDEEEEEEEEESGDGIDDKLLTDRQKYLMRKKLDGNFQDELNIPSLDLFRKVT